MSLIQTGLSPAVNFFCPSHFLEFMLLVMPCHERVLKSVISRQWKCFVNIFIWWSSDCLDKVKFFVSTTNWKQSWRQNITAESCWLKMLLDKVENYEKKNCKHIYKQKNLVSKVESFERDFDNKESMKKMWMNGNIGTPSSEFLWKKNHVLIQFVIHENWWKYGTLTLTTYK